MVWPEVCPEVDPLFDPAVDEEAPAAVPPPAAVPVCSEAIITPSWWSEREVGPGAGFGAGLVFGAALVHWAETLVALVTLNCFMLEVLAELPPALAVAEPFAPGAELAEAWPVGPDAVALLPEFIPAPALFAALGAAPSLPVT